MTNRKTFLLNASSNNIIFVLRIAVNLFITPVCLTLFGVEVFGAYLFSFGFVMSLVFLDFGISKGILRFTAEYKLDEDVQKYEKVLSIGVIINFSAACLAALVMILLGVNFDLFFNIDSRYVPVASKLFYISSVYAFGYFVSLIPQSILQGAQRFKERNKLQLILLLLSALTIIALDYVKFSIEWFCLINTIIFFIGVGLDIWLIKKLKILRAIRFRLFSFQTILRSDFVKYSSNIFVLSVITMLSTQMDKVILSTVGSVSLVAIYSVITKPYSLVKSVFTNLFVALEPIIVSKSSDLVQLRDLIVKATRASVSLLLPMVILIAILFDPLIQLWTQKDIFSPYTIWGIISFLGLIIVFSYATVYRSIYLSGHIGELIKVEQVSSIINGLVSLVATFYLGVGGVILGTLVQSVISIFIVFSKSRKLFSIGISEVLDQKFRFYLLLTILTGCGLYFIDYYFFAQFRGWFILIKLTFYFAFIVVPIVVYVWKERLLYNFLK